MRKAYRIFGGNIVTPDKVIENGTISIDNGCIIEISAHTPSQIGPKDIDAEGQWILPGIIDTHSDAIETEMQPRPRSMFPVESAYIELERKLAICGITTMYHSLCVSDLPTKPDVRKPEMIKTIISIINTFSLNYLLIHNRILLRLEMTHHNMVNYVKNLIQEKAIHQLSFVDHSPGQGQYQSLELYRQHLMNRTDLSAKEVDECVKEKVSKEKVDMIKLQEIADLAHSNGIPISLHDNDSIEKLEGLSLLHTSINEFPINLEIAKEAKRRGMYVVMGAPNLIMGRSMSNNMSALDAIREESVDILCSDYYPASLLQAIFKLYHMGYEMPYAVNMVTLKPAQAMRIDKYTGSLAPGKAADIILVRECINYPLLSQTLVDGQTVCIMNRRERNELTHNKTLVDSAT